MEVAWHKKQPFVWHGVCFIARTPRSKRGQREKGRLPFSAFDLAREEIHHELQAEARKSPYATWREDVTGEGREGGRGSLPW